MASEEVKDFKAVGGHTVTLPDVPAGMEYQLVFRSQYSLERNLAIAVLKTALEHIAKFDPHEPAGPAANCAKQALEEFRKVSG